MVYMQPALTLGLVLIAAGLWMTPRKPAGRRLAAWGCIGLFLWSWEPVAWLTSGTLEWWYPVRTLPPGDAEAIVVLSGSVMVPNSGRPEAEPGASTYLRCQQALWLYRHWRALPVLATGGTTETGVRIAPVMRRTLEAGGIPPEQVWTEDTSTSTYENARNSAVLLRAKGIQRIVLVTEAYHMLRAEGCFRKQGLTTLPAPFGYRTVDALFDWKHLLPYAFPLQTNDDNLHEWIGLIWYKVSGKM